MVRLFEPDSSGFKWGKKKGLGVNKSYTFYYSFTLEGVEYDLYDAVYMFDEREDDPHIGLIIKMWETLSGSKKVKVVWLFRPCEIQDFIEKDVPENELFLASGEGIGLTNVNPLEAISGKCSVVCIKDDSREKLQPCFQTKNADYFVRRTFDVDRRIVPDKIDDVIAGVEAKALLSRICSQEYHPSLIHNLHEKSTEGVEATDNQNLCDKTSEHVANKHPLPENSKKCHTMGGLEISKSGTSEESKNVLITNNDEKTLQKREKTKLCDKIAEESNNLASNGLTRKRKENMKSSKSQLKKQRLDQSVNVKVVDLSQTAMKSPGSASFDNRIMDNDAANKTPEMIRSLSVMPSKGNDDAILKSSLKKNSCKDSDNEKKSEKYKIDKSKWFKLPWDERLKMCNNHGRLLLLSNLDSSWSGLEVEEIIRKAFNLSCSVRMIPQTTCASPNFSHAFATFASKTVAETVITKLTEDCLLLSTGRPLVASVVSPSISSTEELLCGHFVHDKAKYQFQKEKKSGGSTCHFSQPNTIEFEMAREWCLLHKRSDMDWKSLYKLQANDLRKFKAL